MQLKYVQIIILASVFTLQFLFEHVFPQKKENNNWKNEQYNLLIGLLNLLLTIIPASLLVRLIHFSETSRIGLLHQFKLSFALQLIITILILDLWMYVWHRANHQFSFLWRFHSFHHKDTKMNSTTALRFHTVEIFLSYPGKVIISLVFGISFLPLLIYEISFFTAVVIHHSNMKVSEKADSIYRKLFASPRMHRIHHSNDFSDTNSNFGSVFSFWDRLFKSWRIGKQEDFTFGIPTLE